MTRKSKTTNRQSAHKAHKETKIPETPIFETVLKDTGVNPFEPWKKSTPIAERPEYKEMENVIPIENQRR